MNPVLIIIFMIIIGALIGGVTNSLAIKMLFRPYKARYIGKYKIPFTPGLIPKRQQELAKQLGRMVVDHLLTAEGLRRKLEHPEFQTNITEWAQEEVKRLLEHPAAVQELLTKADIDLSSEKMEKEISHWVAERYDAVMENYREKSPREVLSDEWMRKAEKGTGQLADYIQFKVKEYLNSYEGKQKVSELINNYLENQGFFGSMISSFMGSESLTERMYPAIIRYISAQETNDWLRSMLQDELHELASQPISQFEAKIGKSAVGRALGQAVAKSLPIEEWMSRSVAEWSKPVRSRILNDLVPYVVKQLSAAISDRIEGLMKSMHLSEIVQEEVESFQVDRLEEMVLGISRREFKMITYLGALLGGIIGLLQGFIVLFLG
ncbi:DUF445 family protein [Halobacillus rhizosphaerae]|uniref:DUF445 domain-containing protein n=1 Tax=Halobacillus rhizosphaerae TaxID=3064889 RepID=UPI00398A883C